jgi:uncharacterized beta-barrel protein YwiB (DUF1934 family)
MKGDRMAKYLPALIDIRNKQTDEDGDSNEIRVRTEGKLYYLENETVLYYQEEGTSPDGEASFFLTIPRDSEKKAAKMVRFGEERMTIHFEEGTLWETALVTPFGNLNIFFNTQKMDYDLNEDQGRIQIEYTMELSRQNPIRNAIDIRYKVLSANKEWEEER